jgi:cell division septation protein DedD
MDNAMVKRGIGAIVLAIIAALLLGWLLKDKSNQRQEVIDMTIPSLTDSGTEDTTSSLLDSGKSLISNTVDGVSDTGAAVVASASSATDQITDATSSTFNTVKSTITETAQSTPSMKPGFAIRPSQNNEEKQIIDNTQATTQENNVESQQNNNTKIIQQKDKSTDTSDTVIASTKSTAKAVKKAFKPQLVEKKEIKKKAPPKPKKVAKATSTTNIPTTATGKYSIQLLATSSQSRAKKLAQTMKGEGYQVFVTETTRNDKILFRVRVGGHGDRGSAIKAQEGMKKRYLKNFFVQNSLVISN